LTEASNSKINQYRFNGNNNPKIRYSFNDKKISLQNSQSSFNVKYSHPKKFSEPTIDSQQNVTRPFNFNDTFNNSSNNYGKKSNINSTCSFKKRHMCIDENRDEENQQIELNLKDNSLKSSS
jgi:hypothetical protein